MTLAKMEIKYDIRKISFTSIKEVIGHVFIEY